MTVFNCDSACADVGSSIVAVNPVKGKLPCADINVKRIALQRREAGGACAKINADIGKDSVGNGKRNQIRVYSAVIKKAVDIKNRILCVILVFSAALTGDVKSVIL